MWNQHWTEASLINWLNPKQSHRSEKPSTQICSQELSKNASELYDQHRYPNNKVTNKNIPTVR